MKTHFKKSGDTLVISLTGKLDFESYLPLREQLANWSHPQVRSVRRSPDRMSSSDSAPSTHPTKIIFNFKGLEFVGSSGISTFIQTLKEFNEQMAVKPKYCHVRSEYKRIIEAFDESDAFEIFDSEDSAHQSFDH